MKGVSLYVSEAGAHKRAPAWALYYTLPSTALKNMAKCIYKKTDPLWRWGSFQVVWQSLVRVENAFRVQHGLDVSHQSDSLARFTVVDVIPLLQAQPVLGTDAALTVGCPLVHKRLDGGQESRVFGRRGDVQVEVPVAYSKRRREGGDQVRDEGWQWGENYLIWIFNVRYCLFQDMVKKKKKNHISCQQAVSPRLTCRLFSSLSLSRSYRHVRIPPHSWPAPLDAPSYLSPAGRSAPQEVRCHTCRWSHHESALLWPVHASTTEPWHRKTRQEIWKGWLCHYVSLYALT